MKRGEEDHGFLVGESWWAIAQSDFDRYLTNKKCCLYVSTLAALIDSLEIFFFRKAFYFQLIELFESCAYTLSGGDEQAFLSTMSGTKELNLCVK